MYMVRGFDGRPVSVCENLPQAFSRSLTASACGGVGTTVSVVAVDKKDRERVVGTFQRINTDEVWCVTPMFPGGTVMAVNRGDNGVPVRRFGGMPQMPIPAAPQTLFEAQNRAAVADLRSLLTMVHSAPGVD